VRDIELVPLPRAEDCCGFGGRFGVKLRGIAVAMVAEKVENIVLTKAEYVVSTDMGCLMNISGYMKRRGLNVETLHLAELLDRGISLGKASVTLEKGATA